MKVLVLGEAILDRYVRGGSGRLCPEAPVPVVDVEAVEGAAGGAANVAANLASLGAHPTLLTAVGSDGDGSVLVDLMDAAGVRSDRVIQEAGRKTLRKERIEANGHLLLRVDRGSTGPFTAETSTRLREWLALELPVHDAVVVSDYGYGAVPAALRRMLCDRGGRTLVIDAKDLTAYSDLRPTAVKPNYLQTAALLGLPLRRSGDERARQLETRGDELLARTGATLVAVTLDSDGALVFERRRPPYRSYARAAPDARAAGAGDTFVAALTLALSAGFDGPRATDLAAAAASVAVSSPGTTTCTAAALERRLAADRRVMNGAVDVGEAVRAERALGKRIVFTNGCFDLLHRGHITALDQAKALGDVLIVAVNDDRGVRRLKGNGRPVTRLEDRMEVLAALSCVDLVVPFAEDTPLPLLERLRPDVYVKGGDYRAEDLPETAVVRGHGGEVVIVPYVEERSTTGIIERIRDAVEPAKALRD